MFHSGRWQDVSLCQLQYTMSLLIPITYYLCLFLYVFIAFWSFATMRCHHQFTMDIVMEMDITFQTRDKDNCAKQRVSISKPFITRSIILNVSSPRYAFLRVYALSEKVKQQEMGFSYFIQLYFHLVFINTMENYHPSFIKAFNTKWNANVVQSF